MPLFSLIRYLTYLQTSSHLPQSNNTKYLILLWTLINPSILSNIKRNGFAPVELCIKRHKLKYFCDFRYISFHLINYHWNKYLYF